MRIVVNFAPGGSTDKAERPFADRLSKALGQQFVIENKSGASGTIGVEAFVRSAPDGYTFLVTGSPVLVMVPQARKVSWDPFKDLVPVAHLLDYMLPIAVNPSRPVNSIHELQAYGKANPTLCKDKAGADQSSAAAREWVASNAADIRTSRLLPLLKAPVNMRITT